MAKQKPSKKTGKGQSLSLEEQAQLQMLLDRVAVQDPVGESLKQFLGSVRLVLEQSPGVGLAFVEALGSMTTPVALKALEALQEIPAAKPLRRAVKTALYRLGRHGLSPEREQGEAAPLVLVPRPVDRRAEAWAGWPEASGDRGLIVVVPESGAAYLLAMAVVNPAVGFRDLQVSGTTRKGVRALVAELTGHESTGLRPIPLPHALFLLNECAQAHQAQNQALPQEYEVVRHYVASWVTTPLDRGHIYELLHREEIAADPILLRASESLLDLPPLSSWQLSQEAALPLVEKIQGLGESRLVLSRGSQFERVDQLLREAAGEVFTPTLRQYYRRLLEEAALLFWQEERVQEARWALAAAIDLEREVGRFTENTFVLGLLKRALGEASKEQQGEETQTAEERTTESGLIIPGR
ncbi:MAG TPA: hypothetical protein VMU60_05460 [Syntrophobacteria bacterium]|nr:hypothetical protein [Syntrophobacteria bacterium]